MREDLSVTKHMKQQFALSQIRDVIRPVLPAQRNLAGQQEVATDCGPSWGSNEFLLVR
jgi:hypothetical protein